MYYSSVGIDIKRFIFVVINITIFERYRKTDNDTMYVFVRQNFRINKAQQSEFLNEHARYFLIFKPS